MDSADSTDSMDLTDLTDSEDLTDSVDSVDWTDSAQLTDSLGYLQRLPLKATFAGVPQGCKCNLINKKVFFCEFCKISKVTFCSRTPPMAASVNK